MLQVLNDYLSYSFESEFSFTVNTIIHFSTPQSVSFLQDGKIEENILHEYSRKCDSNEGIIKKVKVKPRP